jgi:hypothetical protein
MMQDDADEEDAPELPGSPPNEDSPPDVPTNARPQCPGCERSFNRRSERNRHIVTHLAYHLYCRFDSCDWRGDRASNLKKHWETHTDSGPAPKKEDCLIYDPAPLVRLVISGGLPIAEASDMSQGQVERRAQELDKVNVWADSLGRKPRFIID